MKDLIIACLLAFVIEGIYYALMPEKAQEAMRKMADVKPDILRTAGILIAIVAVVLIMMIKG